VCIAAKHFGKEVEFIGDKEAQNNPPAGHGYVITTKNKVNPERFDYRSADSSISSLPDSPINRQTYSFFP
jgi:hypothetical protein